MNNSRAAGASGGSESAGGIGGRQCERHFGGRSGLQRPSAVAGGLRLTTRCWGARGRCQQQTSLTASELALADPAAPGGDPVALNLEKLFAGKNIDGVTFSQFYGNIVAAAGRELSGARSGVSTQEQLVAQAKEMRDVVQKVNLDEEATILLEFQRAYRPLPVDDASSEITDTTMSMLR